MPSLDKKFDIIIVGAGLIGLSAAIAFGNSGLSIALIDQRALDSAPDDFRASALAPSAERMLSRLDVDITPYAQPIEDMVAYEGNVRAPWKVHFDDSSTLGMMIENKDLRAALRTRLKTIKTVSVFAPTKIVSHTHTAGGVQMTLDASHGEIAAKLLVAADGRNSFIRRCAGITSEKTTYNQSAVVAIIGHEAAHDGLALQRFMHGGPIAVLPLRNNRSQIVWSDKTEAITALKALGDATFINILTERIGDYLGKISLETPLQSYPLCLQIAGQFTGPRLALVGDAAHVIHPLAGQGLNLGFRDVAALADSVVTAARRGQDIGTEGLLGYESWRHTDTRVMASMTHGLNHVFGRTNLALGHMRRAGLNAVNEIAPLKALLSEASAGNLGELPKLMVK